ncbi:MAG: hypothetical protein JXA20_12520 [Spirochaetes bacterium]|nr:hypothetical protein [Spirochaetota bacterium]
MTARRWFYLVASVGVAAFFVLSILNYCIDPIQYFREASFYRPYIHGNYCRYINPGMAKNRRYETVIVGSSYMANTDPAMVDKVLHTPSVNLTMFGATMREIRLILETAIRTGRVKRVVWGLDLDTLMDDPDMFRIPDFPLYLYDDNPWNDFRYIANFDLLFKLSREIIAVNLLHRSGGSADFDSAYNWMEIKKPFFGREQVLRRWKRAQELKGRAERNADTRRLMANGRGNITTNLLPLLRANPSIRFDIIYMPHSILYWLDVYRSGGLDAYVRIKQELFETMKGLNNVTLHDPQSDSAMLYDLDEYCDTGHFSESFNDRFIKALTTHEFTVTGQSIERAASRLMEETKRSLDVYR